jgi:hypothetical protein
MFVLKKVGEWDFQSQEVAVSLSFGSYQEIENIE